MQKVHFMGIGGSGMSAVALLSQKAGYEVEGSDLQEDTQYLQKVKDAGIKTYLGHKKQYLSGVDILAVSPAVYFQEDQGFVKYAKEKNIKVMTWQKFLGEYIQKDKKTISIAGAHGKSTTTALVGLVFEKAGYDPSVMVGAKVSEWDSNYRFGSSEFFICESDEFFDNFLNYTPDTIILTNIEYEHPDYFKSEEALFKSYNSFVQKLTGSKTLIINQDDPGIKKLLNMLPENFFSNINLVGYSLKDKKIINCPRSFVAYDIAREKNKTDFFVKTKHNSFSASFSTRLGGIHNIYNLLAVIVCALEKGIELNTIQKAVKSFSGIGRRVELLGEKDNILVYDDYAHHPTEIKASLEFLRQKYPKKRIIAVVEPHSYSRTKAVLSRYEDCFANANQVFVGPIFKARDKEDFGISAKDIVQKARHQNISFQDDPQKLIQNIVDTSQEGDVVIIMGAGLSYKWSRQILKAL